ncbi:hypothetical protein KSF_109350 [Reticulibacter mediterranei]|uniref:AB hydrolase-1 domain-containing protein n=1 Tax=Reticulibacter mediterranei TaxID=2778369 RepID=A0A8J3J200_9CHLR|nr:alpha/beta hydrolase [Reticulibacter mediterranei]GHP00888.1 hypothetical protein KSF_109350 [Reticulibacter mediterranei]
MVLHQGVAPGSFIPGPEGIALYVETYGSPTARRVLLLTPGGFQATVCYRHFKRFAQEGYQIVVWDPPMQGLSGPLEPNKEFSATCATDCLQAVISHFHLHERETILVSWSLGTTTTLHFLQTHPEAQQYVIGVVLIAGLLSLPAYFSYLSEHDPKLFHLLTRLQSPDLSISFPAVGEFIERLTSRAFTESLTSTPLALEDWYLLRGSTMFSFGRRGSMPTSSLEHLLPQELLAALPLPICLVQGRLDRLVPVDYIRQIIEAVPDLLYYEYDCGHAPFLELPEQVLRDLSFFFNEPRNA